MVAFVQRLTGSVFARHVGTLALGSLLAQGVGIAAAPIVTRLYSPSEYATVALFITLIGTMAPAAAGRYDGAIVVAQRESDIDTLLVLSMWTALFVCILVFLAWMVAGKSLVRLVNAESLGGWWWAIPPVLFMSSAGTVLRLYANRREDYSLISRVSILQAVVTVCTSIALGVMGLHRHGQLVAATVAVILTVAALAFVYRDRLAAMAWGLRPGLWRTAVAYRNYPMFAASTTFVNSITLSLPVLMLTKFFPQADVGQYVLGVRVFSGPLSFVATSVSQVHMRTAAKLVATTPSALPRYTHTLAISLFLVAGIPAALLFAFAEELFGVAFGSSWSKAGAFLTVLLPALVLKFVASSLSGVFAATGNQPVAAAWRIGGLLLTAAGLTVGVLSGEILVFLRWLAITDLIVYGALYAAICYSITHVRPQRRDQSTASAPT